MKDYYKTLGIDKNSSHSDIKKAYRKLALKHHPDKGATNESTMKEINEAYEVLSDESEKKKYDDKITIKRNQESNEFKVKPNFSRTCPPVPNPNMFIGSRRRAGNGTTARGMRAGAMYQNLSTSCNICGGSLYIRSFHSSSGKFILHPCPICNRV
jgi:DnaJ-class molecular chaperone